jgi:acetyltransferase-like isoleucine patch superfamily enzyme
MTPLTHSNAAPRAQSRRSLNCEPGVFVHDHALCESNRVGEGTRIWAFAHVMEGACIGRDCNIGGHAFIESGAVIGDRVTVKNGAMIWNGVVIEDDAFIGPGVLFTNDKHPRSPRGEVAAARYHETESWLVPTRVHRGASIGAGAIILCGVQIGTYATVGAGAVVTRDVPSQRLVLGNPARVAGWVCRCGATLPDIAACSRCERRYHLVGDLLIASE